MHTWHSRDYPACLNLIPTKPWNNDYHSSRPLQSPSLLHRFVCSLKGHSQDRYNKFPDTVAVRHYCHDEKPITRLGCSFNYTRSRQGGCTAHVGKRLTPIQYSSCQGTLGGLQALLCGLDLHTIKYIKYRLNCQVGAGYTPHYTTKPKPSRL